MPCSAEVSYSHGYPRARSQANPNRWNATVNPVTKKIVCHHIDFDGTVHILVSDSSGVLYGDQWSPEDLSVPTFAKMFMLEVPLGLQPLVKQRTHPPRDSARCRISKNFLSVLPTHKFFPPCSRKRKDLGPVNDPEIIFYLGRPSNHQYPKLSELSPPQIRALLGLLLSCVIQTGAKGKHHDSNW